MALVVFLSGFVFKEFRVPLCQWHSIGFTQFKYTLTRLKDKTQIKKAKLLTGLEVIKQDQSELMFLISVSQEEAHSH